ncbi:helix-turn-helix domain-containing protein [Diaphorobacter caeni]|uniref:helix-turn-helix domain-containing protein n=1 Tax=Diaphorobacter caeni TaxID=2784387 RepID=UPI00188F498A|nr:helix-turn-helix transcriptional regulator [Diaphorobacter caeni]MBF5004760.1 helix-turn-helix transcriptional regulator [Diaphorobacter caeni]
MARVTVNQPQPLDEAHKQELLELQRQFGQQLRELRRGKEMTLEQVAEASELHANYVGSVERGERNISLYNIWRIASSLGYPAERLLQNMPVRSQP